MRVSLGVPLRESRRLARPALRRPSFRGCPKPRHRVMTMREQRGRVMTVLIAGGGIGGLTLALSLHQIGVPVRVFESVPQLRPLGVGINVLPHAVRELVELGLMDKLDASGVRTKEPAYFSKRGQPIWSEPRGLEAGYKWPQFSIHRGTLQQILLDAATERLGAANILTSHHLSDWTETTDGVRASFIDKATGKPAGTYEGALLI